MRAEKSTGVLCEASYRCSLAYPSRPTARRGRTALTEGCSSTVDSEPSPGNDSTTSSDTGTNNSRRASGAIVLVILRTAAAICALLPLAACIREQPPSVAHPQAPSSSVIAPNGEAAPSPEVITTTEPAGPSRTQSGSPTRPRVEILDIPRVELPRPDPKCTDSDGQAVTCRPATGPEATAPTLTPPPATTPPPTPTEHVDDSDEREPQPPGSSTSKEADR
jgi:hypothetical protein